MRVTVRPATISDARTLAAGLRPWDAAEAGVFGGDLTHTMESQVLLSDECLALCVEDRCVGLGGVKRVSEGLAVVGFLGRPEVDRVKFSFFRLARRQVRDWTARYGRLCNGVAASNAPCLAWLRRMGAATQEGAFELGGIRFITFYFDPEAAPCAS